MKKLLLILLCLPFIGFGQLDNPRIGMKVGNSFSTITANNFNSLPLEEWNGISEKDRTILKNPGLIIGLYTTTKTRKFFINSLTYKIQNELFYHQKGYKYSKQPVSYFRERFNYIEFTSLFSLIIMNNISLDLGPYWGFFTGGKQLQYHEDYGFSSFDYDVFTFSNIDFGVNTGLSFYLNNVTNINFRFGKGMKNYLDDLDSKNITYQISFGYLFRQ